MYFVLASSVTATIVFISDGSINLNVLSSLNMNPLEVNITSNNINTAVLIPYGSFIIVTSTNISNMTDNAVIMLPNETSTLHLAVICIIHPDSMANTCEVMAVPDEPDTSRKGS